MGELRLNGVHFGAILRDRFAGLGGSQFSGRAMFISGAQKHHFVAARALVARVQVCRQLRADKIAQMLDPVDVRNGGGDKNAFCHDRPTVATGDVKQWGADG